MFLLDAQYMGLMCTACARDVSEMVSGPTFRSQALLGCGGRTKIGKTLDSRTIGSGLYSTQANSTVPRAIVVGNGGKYIGEEEQRGRDG